ncbi:MAG: 4-hydroxybenzoate octaprenyltransferase [Gammaproteobacteria bacterium]|nr:4-hydroxybenzoate octaprenyltransferase [Gammaproteobacteria bacterium]
MKEKWGQLRESGISLYRRHSPYIYDRAREYALLIRLNRPIGTLLLGWPALWALWFSAEGLPDLKILLVFVLGIFVMRSAGCVINDFADRKIDPHVARTRNRPMAAGRVSEREALTLFIILALIAFGLVLTLNTLTIYLSFAAVISAASYPFMKRYTYLPQAFLGIAFGWAIPMAWAAQTESIPQVSWLLFIIVVLWAMAYDSMYAMADREDDIKIGMKSTAILFGDADKLIIGLIQISVMLGLFLLGAQLSMQWPFYAGLTVATVLGVYQQYLIRRREPAACFQAFLNNNWFGAAIFAGIVANYYFMID